MTVIDINEIGDRYRRYVAGAESTNIKCESATIAFGEVLSSEGLQGVTGDAIEADIRNQHLPLIEGLDDVTQLLRQAYTQALDGFRRIVKETSATAVIDTAALRYLDTDLDVILKRKATVDFRINQIYHSIDHLVGVSMSKQGNYKRQAKSTKAILTQTNTRVEQFESVSVRKQQAALAGMNLLQTKFNQLSKFAPETYDSAAFQNYLQDGEFASAMNRLTSQLVEMNNRTSGKETALLNVFRLKVKEHPFSFLQDFNEFLTDNWSWRLLEWMPRLSDVGYFSKKYPRIVKILFSSKRLGKFSLESALLYTLASVDKEPGKIGGFPKYWNKFFRRFNIFDDTLSAVKGDWDRPIKSALKKVWPSLGNLAKFEAKDVTAATKGGVLSEWAGDFGINVAINEAVHKKKNLPKLLWGSAMDTMKDAGPITGAETGAALGAGLVTATTKNPMYVPLAATVGAVAGTFAGLINMGVQIFNPGGADSFYDGLKNWGYQIIDGGDINKVLKENPDLEKSINDATKEIEERTGWKTPHMGIYADKPPVREKSVMDGPNFSFKGLP